MQRYAATIGTFDGVHLGHRHLLAQLCTLARHTGLEPLAVTFSSHPLTLIRPEDAPKPLMPLQLRLHELHSLGVATLVLPFTAELRSLTAGEFMAMLHSRYGVDALLMGFNNRIGSDGPYTPEQYQAIGLQAGLRCVATATPLHSGDTSSSAIRRAISLGRMEQAADMLGRPYRISGKVVHGRRLGRTLGFPTANVLTAATTLLPPPGVYVATTDLGPGAVVNIGHRPTVAAPDEPPTVEAHLLDYSGDLYDTTLSLDLLTRLRPERKFPSLDALRQAIAADTLSAKALIRNC